MDGIRGISLRLTLDPSLKKRETYVSKKGSTPFLNFLRWPKLEK
jgi:hypothetical protein